MNNIDINDFVNDYSVLLLSPPFIRNKHNISESTYFKLLKILNVTKRPFTTKINRLFGPTEIIKVEDKIKPIITKESPPEQVEIIQLNKINDIPIIKKKKKIKRANTDELDESNTKSENRKINKPNMDNLEDFYKRAETSDIRFNNVIKNKKSYTNKDVPN